MSTMRYAVILLVVAAAAPALAARDLLDNLQAGSLTCAHSVLKDAQGQDLKMSAVTGLSQSKVNSVQSSVGSQGAAACLRMKVHCANGNNAKFCTQADKDAAAWKWAYMLTTTNVCSYYKDYAVPSGFAKDVHCCSSDGCNFDKMLDSSVKVLAPGAADP